MDLESIENKYSDCTLCEKLVACRRNIVQGVGNSRARILIVKDTITATEDTLGTLFVGEYSNWVLSMYLHISKYPEIIERRKKAESGKGIDYKVVRNYFLQDVYITSAVMCSGKLTEGAKKGEVRAPATKELANCRPRLYDIIYEVDPWIILAFGKYASSTLAPKEKGLNLNGNPESMIHVTVPGNTLPVIYPMIPSYDLEYAMSRGDYDAQTSVVNSTFNALASAFELKQKMEMSEYA